VAVGAVAVGAGVAVEGSGAVAAGCIEAAVALEGFEAVAAGRIAAAVVLVLSVDREAAARLGGRWVAA
jgi:hypothetical protein